MFVCWNFSVPYQYMGVQVIIWWAFSIIWIWVNVWTFMECILFNWNQPKWSIFINATVSIINTLYSILVVLVLAFTPVSNIGFNEPPTLQAIIWIVFLILFSVWYPASSALDLFSGMHVIPSGINGDRAILSTEKKQTTAPIVNSHQ